jgi:superfamily I DNA and/or RNA helicase
MAFSNHAFYQGRLKASPLVRHHHIGMLSGYNPPDYYSSTEQYVLDPQIPAVFINVRHGVERQIEGSFSFFNSQEAEIVHSVVRSLMSSRLFPEDIGVISPYDQQVNRIRGLLDGTGIEVKTVDGFQGREKEVIIVSLVRANPTGNLGFLSDYRRLNVAVTRARRKLVIIGNRDTLYRDPVYAALLHDLPVVNIPTD